MTRPLRIRRETLQLRVNFSNNSSLGAEQQRGEKTHQQVLMICPLPHKTTPVVATDCRSQRKANLSCSRKQAAVRFLVSASLCKIGRLPTPLQERTVKGVVMQMAAHEVWDIVSNMKQLVEKEPDKAKQMFVSHPQVMTLRPFSLQLL